MSRLKRTKYAPIPGVAVNVTAAGNPVVHGVHAYRNHSCRCDVCTEGQRLAFREYRAAKRAARPVR